jgi:isocitrate dehydrogenase (NAD+)
VRSRFQGVDLVMVRENTEDLYAGVEFPEGSAEAKQIISLAGGRIRDDAAISIKATSAFASARIVDFAFRYALASGRHKVTAVAKDNIMKATDGLFFRTAREVAKRYEGQIAYEEWLVDAMCMQLVQKPELYDVLVMPNLYGDILSDLCAGLVGGLGVAPGANLGDEIALFEAIHGSAPKYAGLNKVNPTALILSGVLMLHHLGETEAAGRVQRAVAAVIAEGKYVTYDLKPARDDPTAVGTREMAEAVIARMEAI